LARHIPVARFSGERRSRLRRPGSRGISAATCCEGSTPRKPISACSGSFASPKEPGLRFQGEFFNIFNHPNFASPTNSLTSALFGRSTQTLANGLGTGGVNGGFNPLNQIGGPRSIQLALKLQF
jgi:hypothetical protein